MNAELAAYERSLGEESMIHGPLANPMLCAKLRGYELFDIFWEAVERLERCGFNVIACTCDGLSVNKSFFKLRGPGECIHKVLNPYSTEKRYLFFISDPPHLIKTVRNSWSSSKRLMWLSCEIH